MSKNIFKVLGVLIAAALFVSIAVGGVSAYTIAADDKLNINIVDGSLVLTKDVPDWVYDSATGEWVAPSASDFGNFVSAETAYGALRTAYGNYNVPYTGTVDFSTGTYAITSVNGVTAPTGYYWLAYVNGVVTYNLNSAISNNAEVAFILTNDFISTNYADIATESVLDATAFIVTIKSVNNIYDDSFTGNGMTGKAVLEALAAQGAFTVSISEPTEAYPYAWLNSINNISKDWTKTGYGFAVLLKESGQQTYTATDALNRFTVSTGDELVIAMAPSTLGGTWTGQTASAGYYLNAATDVVTITIA